MKLAEAYVNITAKTGKFFKALRSVRSGLSGIMKVAAKMAVAVVAAFAAITYAAWKFAKIAMVQERAEKMLDSTLKSTGQSVEKYGKQLRAAASEMQKATIYGDEFLLGLMSQGMNLGITADKIGEMTKLAIGLSTAFPAMDLTAAMRNIALATMGETTMLSRYIPALRGVTTQAEKWNIVQQASIGGWQQARAEVETAMGAWEQTKNILGDLSETVGTGLLPLFGKLRDFLSDNTDKISDFAKRVRIEIEYLTGVLKNFWQDTSWGSRWDVLKSTFISMLEAMATIAVSLGTAIGKALVQSIELGIAEKPVTAVQTLAYLDRLAQLRADKSRAAGLAAQKTRQPGEGRFEAFLRGEKASKEAQGAMPTYAEAKATIQASNASATAARGREILKPMIEEITNAISKFGVDVGKDMDGVLSDQGKAAKENLELMRHVGLETIKLERMSESIFGKPADGAATSGGGGALDWGKAIENMKNMWGDLKEKLAPAGAATGGAGAATGGAGAAKGKKGAGAGAQFEGLAEAWKRVQLSGLGADSPVELQKKQVEESKKQTMLQKQTQDNTKKIVDAFSPSGWMARFLEPKPSPVE